MTLYKLKHLYGFLELFFEFNFKFQFNIIKNLKNLFYQQLFYIMAIIISFLLDFANINKLKTFFNNIYNLIIQS